MTKLVGTCHLRQLLMARNMTQRELARRMGSTVQQLQHYIHNRRLMTVETAKRIMLILDCTFDELYSWEPRADDKEQ